MFQAQRLSLTGFLTNSTWQEEKKRLQKTLKIYTLNRIGPIMRLKLYTLNRIGPIMSRTPFVSNLPDLLTRPEDRTSKTRAFRSSFGST